MIEKYQTACPHHMVADQPLFVGTYGGRLTKRVVQVRLDRAATVTGLATSIAPSDLRTGAILAGKMAGRSYIDLMLQHGVRTISPIVAAFDTPDVDRSSCVRAPRRHLNSEEDYVLRRFQTSLISVSKLSFSTAALYGGDVRSFLLSIEGVALGAITADLIEDHLTAMGTKYQQSTVLRFHAALCRFGDWLVSEKILDYDPIRGLVPVPTHEKVLPEFTEPDEVDRILRTLDSKHSNIDASRSALYVSLCGIDGVESSEACSITRSELEDVSRFCSETRLRADRVLRMRPLAWDAPVLVIRGVSKQPSRQAMGRALYSMLALYGLPLTNPRKLRASAIVRRLRSDSNLKSVARFARLVDVNGLVPYMTAAGMFHFQDAEAAE